MVEKAEERPSQNIIEKAEQTQPEKVQEQPKKRVSFQEKVRTQTIPRDFQDRFRQNFHSEIQVSAVYTINITDQERILRIAVDSGKLDVSYTSDESADVIIRLSSGVLNRITMGEMNFQRTFMSGDMKFKGDFKTLRALDQIFHFS